MYEPWLPSGRAEDLCDRKILLLYEVYILHIRNGVIVVYDGSFFLFCFREYFLKIDRPYEVRYDPFTSSMVLLNSKESILKMVEDMRFDLEKMEKAMEKVSLAQVY